MFRTVLKRLAAILAVLCAVAVLGIIGRLETGAGLEIVPGALGLTICSGILGGLAYLI